MNSPERDRNLDHIQRDVDFANRYRLEYIKHLMSLAAGIFVISLGLLCDNLNNANFDSFRIGIIIGWMSLILSICGGIFHMKAWDRFYISYRKSHKVGVKKRTKINRYRKVAEFIQVVFFILGVILIFVFVLVNI